MDNKTSNRTSVIVSGHVKANGIKTAKLMGKDYSVLPAIMMVEGSYYPYVENVNEATSLYFSAEDLKQSVNTWNGRPVAINHPDGQVTCNCPENYEKQWVGYVFNAEYDVKSSSLKSELWIDADRGKFITNMVNSGKQIDVSIGAFGDLVPNRSIDKEYDYNMSNIVGDHLAVLPDGDGACSWEDGCGIRATVYSKRSDKVSADTQSSMHLKTNNAKRGGKMADCEETKVEHIHRVDVEATVKEPDVMTMEQMLNKVPSDVRDRITTAMKSYDESRTKHIEKIAACKSASFCSKALGNVTDLSLLETISELVSIADAEPVEAKQEAAVDYQFKAVNAASPNTEYATFQDMTWDESDLLKGRN